MDWCETSNTWIILVFFSPLYPIQHQIQLPGTDEADLRKIIQGEKNPVRSLAYFSLIIFFYCRRYPWNVSREKCKETVLQFEIQTIHGKSMRICEKVEIIIFSDGFFSETVRGHKWVHATQESNTILSLVASNHGPATKHNFPWRTKFASLTTHDLRICLSHAIDACLKLRSAAAKKCDHAPFLFPAFSFLVSLFLFACEWHCPWITR